MKTWSNLSAYIFGTSHSIQLGTDNISGEIVTEYEAEVKRICEEKDIEIIVEEASKDGLNVNNVAETVCQRLFKKEKIPVVHIDLDCNLRRELGLDDWMRCRTFRDWFSDNNSSDRIGFTNDESALLNAFDNVIQEVRDRLFVVRILKECTGPSLFICGSDHVVPVARLLRGLGVATEIVYHDFGGTPSVRQ